MGSLHVPHRSDTASSSESDKAPARRRAVLLINLGSPDDISVSSVRSYLREFLSDPAVIRLPRGLGWFNGPLGRMIARYRAPHAAKMYSRVWADRGSPLKLLTEEQASSLEEALPRGWSVFFAMRYGNPNIRDTLRMIVSAGFDDLTVVPMYPHYSGPTTGTALHVLYDALKEFGSHLQVSVRNDWFDDHGYVNAQSSLIETYAKSSNLTPENTFLVFSAHGLPISYVRAGDPYPEHVARTAALVGQRLGWPMDRMTVAFQSRFGPAAWLSPYTDEVLGELAKAGEKRIMVCPVSFTADCLETLDELDIRNREMVEGAGSELFLCPALDTYTPFISALKHLVLRGPQRIVGEAKTLRQFKPQTVQEPVGSFIDSLVMVGSSIKGRLDHDGGPEVRFSMPDGLRKVKRSQCEVPDLLRQICEVGAIREGWLWNTCHRYEFYGWLQNGEVDRDQAAREIRKNLFGDEEIAGNEINVLFGAEAWHHLLKTAVGLNSGLPGERDILEQMKAAHRLAERAGTVGVLARRLMDEVTEFDTGLRSDTEWGRFDHDYCHASIERLAKQEGIDLPSSRIVVIGGSTTSASVLKTLIERFEVSPRQLTLIYRGHKNGGQMKMLRKAIGQGKRLRVHDYDERCVEKAIAGADVVVFGIDRKQPVFNMNRLRDFCCFAGRPLTIFDYNMFGSTEGASLVSGVKLFEAPVLEAEVRSFADRMCETDLFGRAVDAALEGVRCRVAEDSESKVAVPCDQPATPRVTSDRKPREVASLS